MTTITLVSIQHGSARFGSADQTKIDCIARFSHIAEDVPFTACQSDPYDHAQAAWAWLMSGAAGPIAAYEPPPAHPQGE